MRGCICINTQQLANSPNGIIAEREGKQRHKSSSTHDEDRAFGNEKVLALN